MMLLEEFIQLQKLSCEQLCGLNYYSTNAIKRKAKIWVVVLCPFKLFP